MIKTSILFKKYLQ